MQWKTRIYSILWKGQHGMVRKAECQVKFWWWKTCIYYDHLCWLEFDCVSLFPYTFLIVDVSLCIFLCSFYTKDNCFADTEEINRFFYLLFLLSCTHCLGHLSFFLSLMGGVCPSITYCFFLSSVLTGSELNCYYHQGHPSEYKHRCPGAAWISRG